MRVDVRNAEGRKLGTVEVSSPSLLEVGFVQFAVVVNPEVIEPMGMQMRAIAMPVGHWAEPRMRTRFTDSIDLRGQVTITPFLRWDGPEDMLLKVRSFEPAP